MQARASPGRSVAMKSSVRYSIGVSRLRLSLRFWPKVRAAALKNVLPVWNRLRRRDLAPGAGEGGVQGYTRAPFDDPTAEKPTALWGCALKAARVVASSTDYRIGRGSHLADGLVRATQTTPQGKNVVLSLHV